MNWPDFNGIAACIAAIGGLATVSMQVISFFDNRRAKREQQQHKEILAAIDNKVSALTGETPEADK